MSRKEWETFARPVAPLNIPIKIVSKILTEEEQGLGRVSDITDIINSSALLIKW